MSMIDTSTTQQLERFLDLNVYRHSLITSNMANIDTPGYRTRDIDFRAELQRASSNLDYASFSPAAHQVQGLLERPDGNNVNIDRESLLLSETQLRFNAGVQVLRAEFRRLSLAINEGK